MEQSEKTARSSKFSVRFHGVVQVQHGRTELHIPARPDVLHRGLTTPVELPTCENASSVGIAQRDPAALAAGRSRIHIQRRTAGIEQSLAGLEILRPRRHGPLIHPYRGIPA